MSAPRDVAGLTAVIIDSFRRAPLRTRASNITRAGWRLELSCSEGRGAVVVAEASAAEVWHRGEGLLLGWPQEKLEELYKALTASDELSDPPGPMLG